jgi:hypothetical protein
MAETINTALLCPFTLNAAYTLTVSDASGSPRSPPNINPSGTVYYYAITSPSGGTGASEILPLNFLAYVVDRLNSGTGFSYWSGTVTAEGFVKLTYSGGGTGTVSSWGSGNVVGTLLGYGSTAVGPLATGASQTAAKHPPFVLYAIGRGASTGWDRKKPVSAYAVAGDGRTYGWSDRVRRLAQTFDLIGHPSTWTTRTSLSAAGTPLYPDTASRFITPPSTLVTASDIPALPWSVLDFIDAAPGHDLAAFLGTFQTALTGGTTTFDRVHLDPDFHQGDSVSAPMQTNWSARYNVRRFGLRLVTKDVSM